MATPRRARHHLRPVIRVQCAWCERVLDSKKDGTAPDRVSHGICPACALQHFGVDITGLDQPLDS